MMAHIPVGEVYLKGDLVIVSHLHQNRDRESRCGACLKPIRRGVVHFRSAVRRKVGEPKLVVVREHVACTSTNADYREAVMVKTEQFA